MAVYEETRRCGGISGETRFCDTGGTDMGLRGPGELRESLPRGIVMRGEGARLPFMEEAGLDMLARRACDESDVERRRSCAACRRLIDCWLDSELLVLGVRSSRRSVHAQQSSMASASGTSFPF